MRSSMLLTAAAGVFLFGASPLFGHDAPSAEHGAVAPALPSFEYAPPEPGSYRLPRIKPAADGRVLDTDGRDLALSSLLDGKLTVLSFIYTRCADVCPMATLFLHDLRAEALQDARLREVVHFISLSFDPDHDTPEVMSAYASAMAAHSTRSWAFLTTAGRAEIEHLLTAYDQAVIEKANPDDAYGPLSHQLRLYLIDSSGWVRNIYNLDYMDPRLVLNDLRTLAIEEKGQAARR